MKARGWLVPMAVRLGAVGLLGLAVFNPDLYIAEQNIARVDSTIGTDYVYLADLSADAYPAIWKLPQDQFACVTGTGELSRLTGDDWLEWNLGRARAARPAGRAADGDQRARGLRLPADPLPLTDPWWGRRGSVR